MNPIFDDRDIELKGNHLSQKKIDVVVTGGIACIETPKLVRELRRYGAEVRVIMTPSAQQFITPLVFEWASKNPVITELTGSAEHITHADAVIVAPTTLDFISKLALGLADTAAATLVQSAFSRMPVFIAPAMHLSLQGNPAYAKNLLKLREIDRVVVLSTAVNEGKAKMMDFESIVAEVCHQVNKTKSIYGLISLGPTRSYADDVRYLSNRSTGALGIEIADELFRSGFELTLVSGPLQKNIPSYLPVVPVETREKMQDAFQKRAREVRPQFAIFAAAVLDFEFDHPREGKTSSAKDLSLSVKSAPKLIDSVDLGSCVRVGFKLESRLSEEELKSRVLNWVAQKDCDIVVANRLEDITEKTHRAWIWSKRAKTFSQAESKKEIAIQLRDYLRQELLN